MYTISWVSEELHEAVAFTIGSFMVATVTGQPVSVELHGVFDFTLQQFMELLDMEWENIWETEKSKSKIKPYAFSGPATVLTAIYAVSGGILITVK